MDKNECKQWLDRVVNNLNKSVSLKRFNDNIKLCGPDDSIHVYSGIFDIAESVGVVVKEEIRDCDEYPYKYYFNYRGFYVFQLSVKKIWRNDNANHFGET